MFDDKWHYRFISLAGEVAEWSKDPSTKCGAVIVRPDKTIASVGYNGFPRGCSDFPGYYDNRELKYQRVIHAEMNAILSANEPVTGYIMYCWPGSLTGACNRCAAHLIQAGIKVVAFQKIDSERVRRRNGDPSVTLDMYDEAGVEVIYVG